MTLRLLKFAQFIKNAIFSILAKTTVGVRVLLIHEGKILLVKHTYQPGWCTIGGGVDQGETPLEAIKRELQEEVGVTLASSSLQLFAVYYSQNSKRDDYIILYTGQGCIQKTAESPEIAELQWFPLDQLPNDLSPATRCRIQEYLGERTIGERW